MYPQTIIEDSTAKYTLSLTLQQELRESLLVPGIQSIIEHNILSPDDLIYHAIQPAVIMPVYAAKQLVLVYMRIRQTPEFLSGEVQLTQFYFWLTVNNSVHISVVPPFFAYRILNFIDGLAKFTRRVEDNPAALKEWDDFKVEVNEFEKKTFADQSAWLLAALSLLGRCNLYDAAVAVDKHAIENLLSRYAFGCITTIEKGTRKYFKSTYGEEVNVTFSPKTRGGQLGRIAHLHRSGQNPFSFFVKTHQYGRNSAMENVCICRLDIDIRELFVYKVLEYTGFAPKVHFFGDDSDAPYQTELYIATQNAAHTKATTRRKTYSPLDELWFNYERSLEYQQQIDSNVKVALMRKDFLEELFALEDIHAGNIGRIDIEESDHVRQKWKIVDFRLKRGIQVHGYNVTGMFFGFRRDYSETDLEARMMYGGGEIEWQQNVMQMFLEFEYGLPKQSSVGNHLPLLVAVEQAFCDVARFAIQNIPLDRIYRHNDVFGTLNVAETTDEELIKRLRDDRPSNGYFMWYVKIIRNKYITFAKRVSENSQLAGATKFVTTP